MFASTINTKMVQRKRWIDTFYKQGPFRYVLFNNHNDTVHVEYSLSVQCGSIYTWVVEVLIRTGFVSIAFLVWCLFL